jgi:aminopeptidase N
LHSYIEQWHGKHPMPFDFFNCMNTGSGVNLNWFWKRWFFDNGVPDQAISKVDVAGNQYTVIITSVGTKPVPVDLAIIYKDGNTQLLHKSIAVWENGNKATTLSFTAKKAVKKLILGNSYDADVNKDNNMWTAR